MGTPHLWTHIDLTIGQLQDEGHRFYVEPALQRSEQLPLHVHIAEFGAKIRNNRFDIAVSLLAPHASRILSLRVACGLISARETVLGIFRHTAPKSLCAFHLHDTYNYEAGEQIADVLNLLFASDSETSPRSLQTLSLRMSCLPIQNFTFSELVELKLVLEMPGAFTPTLSQVAGVLAACPRLRVLALVKLGLSTESEVPVCPVFLPNLEILDLRATHITALLPLLSIMALSSTPLSISVSVDPHSSIDDLRRLRPFLQRSFTTRLCMVAMQGIGDLDMLLEFLADELPSIEELALYHWPMRHQPTRSLNTDHFSRLHTLHIIQCSIEPDVLRYLVAHSAVQLVQIEPSPYGDYYSSEDLSDIGPSVRDRKYQVIGTGEPDFEWPLGSYLPY